MPPSGELLERALRRRLVGAPAQKFGAVPEAIPGDVIEADLDHQLRTQRLPLAAAFGTPAARTAGRLAGKSGRLAQRFQPLGQCAAVVIGDGRGEADMIE